MKIRFDVVAGIGIGALVLGAFAWLTRPGKEVKPQSDIDRIKDLFKKVDLGKGWIMGDSQGLDLPKGQLVVTRTRIVKEDIMQAQPVKVMLSTREVRELIS